MSIFRIFVFVFLTSFLSAQSGIIKGKVTDELSNDPLEFVNIFLRDLGTGTITDIDGNYIIEDLKPGFYTIQASFIGYNSAQESEIEVTSSRPTTVDFQLSSNTNELEEVVVKAESFRRTSESPLSLRNIGITEIKRNPGGNRDISIVIRSFPGVTSTASFRNDLIIRGGSPNENRFYLDDVEIPNINHFATQGASGGPASILNVDFIKEVDFFSGAFPANRNNSLSSVFNFRQIDGRDDRLGVTATLGATDIGATLEGPIGEKTTFLFSARRSYLQFLFAALELPFLPTYNDFNLKVKTRLDKRNEITFIGIGAIDDFELNLDANETEDQRFNLARLPVNNQWNYTNGLVYKRYGDNGFTTFVISRNMINFDAIKYLDNDESSEDNLILDYNSQEIENHLRIERTQSVDGWKLVYGGRYDYVKYNNSTFNRIFTGSGSQEIMFSNDIALHKYGVNGQVSKSFLNDNLDLSLGLQMGGNTYSEEMSNPLGQLSPRFSLSYAFAPKWRANVNSGIYYQVPPYTVLGYKENGVLVNKENDVKHVRATHFVAGLEYLTDFDAKITVEGYYKIYERYPLLIRDSISLANVGGDFGVIGNEPVVSMSDGRTYGLEFFYQQKLYKGFYGLAAYTLGWSEFTNIGDEFTSSSWDSRHIVSMTLGKQLGKDWEVGAKWRYQSGLPRSPFNPDSDLVVNWEVNAQAIPDFGRINSLRNDGLSEFDIRIDKRWFFEKWSLNVFLDLRNVFGAGVSQEQVLLDVELDDDGLPIGDPVIVNPNAPANEQRYKTKTILDEGGNILPTIGVIVKI